MGLFLPFVAGAHGYFQARDRTCVGLAARSQRDLDDGPVDVTDPGELAQIERQARRVYVKSIALATAMVLAFMLIPAGH